MEDLRSRSVGLEAMRGRRVWEIIFFIIMGGPFDSTGSTSFQFVLVFLHDVCRKLGSRVTRRRVYHEWSEPREPVRFSRTNQPFRERVIAYVT
jgi:hypothetical protein